MRTDDDARANGLTRLVYAECELHDGIFRIHPDADLDGIIEAWDTDEHQLLRLRGWLWSFDEQDLEGDNHA
jgi:hypothetical protein